MYTWALLALALIGAQVALYRAGRLDGFALVLLIQIGIGVFIWHDWRKPPAS